MTPIERLQHVTLAHTWGSLGGRVALHALLDPDLYDATTVLVTAQTRQGAARDRQSAQRPAAIGQHHTDRAAAGTGGGVGMTYWIIYRDTFDNDYFPLYGPIANRRDAHHIADAQQAEIRDGWTGSPELMDEVMVWADAKKRQFFGDQAALYPTLPEGGTP